MSFTADNSQNLCILLDFSLSVSWSSCDAVPRVHLPSRASERSRSVQSAISDHGHFVSKKGKVLHACYFLDNLSEISLAKNHMTTCGFKGAWENMEQVHHSGLGSSQDVTSIGISTRLVKTEITGLYPLDVPI